MYTWFYPSSIKIFSPFESCCERIHRTARSFYCFIHQVRKGSDLHSLCSSVISVLFIMWLFSIKISSIVTVLPLIKSRWAFSLQVHPPFEILFLTASFKKCWYQQYILRTYIEKKFSIEFIQLHVNFWRENLWPWSLNLQICTWYYF